MNLYVKEILHTLVDSRNTSEEVDIAIGYGSAVMEHGDQRKSPGLDIILVVKDVIRFHQVNMRKYPEDYSLLMHLGGAEMFTRIQDTGGAISYNLMTTPKNHRQEYGASQRIIKYGVISTEAFIKDLREWLRLYVAGRMHKPFYIIKQGSAEIQEVIEENLSFAVRVALLLLAKDEVTHEELFKAITSLSYMGDPRPEHPDKVRNIVSANREQFHSLYKNVLTNNEFFQNDQDAKLILPPHARDYMKLHLPKQVAAMLPEFYMTFDDNVFQKVMTDAIQRIVSQPALIQIFKGVLTGKPSETIPYGISKGLKSPKIRKILTPFGYREK
ncbi:MAG: hypothetical protein ACK4NC_03665 [Candidatus Gracilibacteria bacterium]